MKLQFKALKYEAKNFGHIEVFSGAIDLEAPEGLDCQREIAATLRMHEPTDFDRQLVRAKALKEAERVFVGLELIKYLNRSMVLVVNELGEETAGTIQLDSIIHSKDMLRKEIALIMNREILRKNKEILAEAKKAAKGSKNTETQTKLEDAGIALPEKK